MEKEIGTYACEKIYKFIVDYKRNHDGNSPTMREIMEACGISSTSMVIFYLQKLVEQGFIRRPEPYHHAASIEIVGGQWLYIGRKHEPA